MTKAYALQGAAARSATEIDSLFFFIAAVSLFFFFLVEGLLIYFAVRYRRRKASDATATSDVTSNLLLEVVWTVIPSIVVIAFFVYGYLVYRDVTTPPKGSTDIQVTAQQFFYRFQHPDGRKEVGELHVLLGTPVKFIMTSKDVIHGFFLPDFRLKQDILPGRYTYLYLRPDRPGSYDIFCTQYCGVGHSTMRAKMIVMAARQYEEWAEAGRATAGVPLVEQGKDLLAKSGCLGCHTTDGTSRVGPTFLGLFGGKVTLSDGRSVTADEEYIRESVYDPGAKLVQGFPNVMPTFRGTLSAEDVTAILAYLKTLRGEPGEHPGTEERHEKKEHGRKAEGEKRRPVPSAADGKGLAEKFGCLNCHTVDGSSKIGPTWKGLYGSKIVLSGGRTVTADEAYLRESILDPGAQVVKGFPNVMPSFKGAVSGEDIESIIAYLRTLR